MNGKYRTVLSLGEAEVIINKSRFIGYSMAINNEEQALSFIHEIKEKHRDASHNVYAYVVGENSNIQRFSDDGEPSGTAGIPALEVIKKEELRNIVVVITRYFGGVKLGGGGLIRAYTKAAKIGIDAGGIIEMTPHINLIMTVDYTLYGRVENYLMVNEHIVDELKFNQDVSIYISIDVLNLETFKITMKNLTNGSMEIIEMDNIYLPLKDGKRLN